MIARGASLRNVVDFLAEDRSLSEFEETFTLAEGAAYTNDREIDTDQR